jgi:glycosyltransferase involved in cell wall biosynthesis
VKSLYYLVFPDRHPEKIEQAYVMDLLRQGGCDIFHPTLYQDYYLGLPKKMPVVLTVFDMIFELFPQQYAGRRAQEITQKKMAVVNRADHIISISHSTRRDLCRLYGIDPKRVSVVPLANSLTLDKESLMETVAGTLPERYILFVGIRDGYKNFLFFLSSMIDIFRRDQSLMILCTGPAFTETERQQIKSLGLESRVRWMKVVSDAVLATLYRHATAFVFPSLYEGFGLPLLEAMSCGCPVVASNTSSFPEVAGDAAVLFDPASKESISTAVERVLGSSELRSEMREKGIARQRKFSWEKTAEETLKVYHSMLASIS